MTKLAKVEQTSRGFKYVKFEDLFDNKCSIQESSLATDDAIWFGISTTYEGENINARMHLNRDDVEALLPYLQRFVETGTPFENGKYSNLEEYDAETDETK